MKTFNDYLEEAKTKDEKPLKQSALNSMVARVKEDIKKNADKGEKTYDHEIHTWLTDLLGENYQYAHDAASQKQIKKARIELKEYRDKLENSKQFKEAKRK